MLLKQALEIVHEIASEVLRGDSPLCAGGFRPSDLESNYTQAEIEDALDIVEEHLHQISS